MNNESNSTAIFLQEIDNIEKELAAQLMKDKSDQTHSLLMSNGKTIDSRLKMIFTENDFKTDKEKYPKLKNMLSSIEERVNQRDKKLLQAINQLLKDIMETKSSKKIETILTTTNLGIIKKFGIKELNSEEILNAVKVKNNNIDILGLNVTNIKTDSATIFGDGTLYHGQITVTFNIITNNEIKKDSTINNTIYCITKDSNGNIYSGGRTANIFKTNKQTNKTEIITKIHNDHVWAINSDYQNNIWIGTWDGTLYKYNINEKMIKKINNFKGTITAIISDKNNNIYLTENHTCKVYKYSNDKNSFTEMAGITHPAWSLAIDNNDVIYVGTTKGVFKSKIINNNEFDSKLFTIDCKQQISIRSLVIDKENNIYAGTRENVGVGGVYKCKNNESKFSKIIGTNGEVFSLAADSHNNIYAGTWISNNEGKLFQYSNLTNQFIHLSDISNKGAIEWILIDKEDNMYFGTKNSNSDNGNLYSTNVKVTVI